MVAKKQTEKVVDPEVVEQNSLVQTDQPQSNPYLPMIDKALGSEAGMAQLDKILDLQIKWEENEAKKAFNRAFAAFKSEAIEIIKDKRVGYENRDGSFTGYSHATLGKIVETVTPFLSKHGLSHRWDVQQEGSISTVTCFITHELGFSSQVSMTAGKDDSGKKNQIQQVASTVTYLQRYTFLSATGLAAKDQDDDGANYNQPEELEMITEGQVMDLSALIAEVKANEEQYLEYLTIQCKTPINDLAAIPADAYQFAVKVLERKRDK